MASLIESEAHFEQRAKEYGVDDGLLTVLKNSGVTKLASLAFAVNRPGADFNEREFDQWAQAVNGGNPLTIGQAAALRRLHFEAEVTVTASFRQAVETSETAPRPVPIAERNSRMDEIRKRLGGLHIYGNLEPSQSLLDETCHQYETRCIKHIEPAKCTSKEQEVSSGRADKRIKLDGNSLTVKETKHVPDETISTTLQLSQCLTRRGIAYDFAGLISYNEHSLYADRLLKHLSTEPPTMYNATTLQQVLRADKQVFAYISQNCQDIRPDAAGTKPLDAMLTEALRDYNTAFHLVPLPKESNSYGSWKDKPDASEPSPYRQNKGKGKGKTKNKSSTGSNVAPKGFPGCVGRDAKNRPLCFNYNINQCDRAPAGGACPRGRHVCFKAGCFKPHSYKAVHGNETTERPAE